MPLYGKQEIEYYQITPVGASRLQMGNFPERISNASRQVMKHLAELGGTAEIDELKMQTGANPHVLKVALKRLTDLGYVVPVALEQPTAPTEMGR